MSEKKKQLKKQSRLNGNVKIILGGERHRERREAISTAYQSKTERHQIKRPGWRKRVTRKTSKPTKNPKSKKGKFENVYPKH